MEHGAVVEPAVPLTPSPPAAQPNGGGEERTISLLGPFVFGAACGWILLSFVNLGELAFGFTRNVELANALWLAYIQPALLFLVSGIVAARSVLQQRASQHDAAQPGRLDVSRLALALLIAWAPYLILFALPHGILRLDTYREASEPGTQRILMFVQNALTPAVGWLVGLLAVFVWGRPANRARAHPLRSTLARWLAVALVASAASALCAKLEMLAGQVVDRLLIAPIDPTCGGACTADFVPNRLLLPIVLAAAFGVLGGIVGGYMRFGRAFSRASAQAESDNSTADALAGESPAAPQAIQQILPRTLPGSAYWGSFLLGILVCLGWLLALYLSLSTPAAPFLSRILAQIALLLVFPAGVVLYAGWRRQPGVVLPRRAIFALLAVVVAVAAVLPGLILLARPNEGLTLLAPLFAPLFLPLFVPTFSLGVAIGLAWSRRRPNERHPIVRPGGVVPALCGWVGFALPLAGLMTLEVISIRTHSITCGNFGGCVLAAAITLSSFELLATVVLFALVLILTGLALGRSLARGLPPATPRPARNR